MSLAELDFIPTTTNVEALMPALPDLLSLVGATVDDPAGQLLRESQVEPLIVIFEVTGPRDTGHSYLRRAPPLATDGRGVA